jgi:tetratricopeptide (TPR) repeat protein
LLLTSAGIYFRERGEFSRAESAYREALRIAPDHSDALFNLGILYELYLNRPAEAVAHYRTYLGIVSPPSATSPSEAGGEALSPEMAPDAAESGLDRQIQQVALWIAALEKKTGETP